MVIMNNANGVYAWGKNTYGQCGQSKTKTELFQPSKITALINLNGSDGIIKMIALGENHSVFLMGDNTVQTCGSNEFGQLGLIQDAADPTGAAAQGGAMTADAPSQIEKS
jgi:alpha-tubulin suppressor-like RCC1 family protein